MIRIYFDGASRSNNGSKNQTAAIGIVVFKEVDNGLFEKAYEYGEEIGNHTGNYAEWKALIKALELVKKTQHKYSSYEILGDSKLVIEQFNGNWKVKDMELKKLYQKAKEIEKEIKAKITVSWIERKKNPADKIAKNSIKIQKDKSKKT